MFRFLIAFTLFWIIVLSPIVLILFIIYKVTTRKNKNFWETTPEERNAANLQQIRYDLDSIVAKQDHEMWTRKP